MIKVYVKKHGNYALNTPRLKKKLKEYLTKGGIVSDADVSISFVGEKKMMDIARKYLKEKQVVHNILTFSFIEQKDTFVEPPDNIIHLGEIVICYPKVVEEAKREGKLIEEKVFELTEHGAAHLLGKHHEESG